MPVAGSRVQRPRVSARRERPRAAWRRWRVTTIWTRARRVLRMTISGGCTRRRGRVGGDRPDRREGLGAVGPGGPGLEARLAGEEHQPERRARSRGARGSSAPMRASPLLDLAAVGDERRAGARGEQRALERGQPLALGGDGRDDLDPEQARELAGVDVDAGLLGLVAHVQAQHERAAALEQLGGQASARG